MSAITTPEIFGARREENPQAFVLFHVHHIVYGRDVSERAVRQAIELSDTKRCSVAATTDGGNTDELRNRRTIRNLTWRKPDEN